MHYEEGVRLRFGKNKGTLNPGFHWKVPFADTIMTHMVKTTTLSLSEQTVTTKDWKQVVAKAVIKYEVSDVKILLLEVNDPIDALSDITQGIIRDAIISREWHECNDVELSKVIKNKAKTQAAIWGRKITEVTLTDWGERPTYRLFNSNTNNLLI